MFNEFLAFGTAVAFFNLSWFTLGAGLLFLLLFLDSIFTTPARARDIAGWMLLFPLGYLAINGTDLSGLLTWKPYAALATYLAIGGLLGFLVEVPLAINENMNGLQKAWEEFLTKTDPGRHVPYSEVLATAFSTKGTPENMRENARNDLCFAFHHSEWRATGLHNRVVSFTSKLNEDGQPQFAVNQTEVVDRALSCVFVWPGIVFNRLFSDVLTAFVEWVATVFSSFYKLQVERFVRTRFKGADLSVRTVAKTDV